MQNLKALGGIQLEMIEDISGRINKIHDYVTEMTEKRKQINEISEVPEQAIQYCEKIFPYFDKIRYEVDKLELIVDDELWPLPKYRELLFAK